MHVIWRRPDGFHNANPSDYVLQPIDTKANLWLHKKDKDYYPFRISGGWQDENATKNLNRLINLIGTSYPNWLIWLKKCYYESSKDQFLDYIAEQINWLDTLSKCLRGDKWEIQIMKDVIDEIKNKILLHKKQMQKDIKDK